jgi:hypothetical protein
VIGGDFEAVLAAAQGQRGGVLTAWRDASPALLRYLRVIAPQSAEDVACRDLAACGTRAGFRGDEQR